MADTAVSPESATAPAPGRLRQLVMVLGDQLDANASAFDGFDPALDAV
jgi:deoxyribodipyrimidine photolyase-related protein